MKLVTNSKFPIRMVQTDNGTEFTNTLIVTKAKHKTLFEQALEDMDILDASSVCRALPLTATAFTIQGTRAAKA